MDKDKFKVVKGDIQPDWEARCKELEEIVKQQANIIRSYRTVLSDTVFSRGM